MTTATAAMTTPTTPESDDTPLAILREVRAVYDYFYAPRMDVEMFELKFTALKKHVDDEIARREREYGVKLT